MTLRNKIILGCLLMAPLCVPLICISLYGLVLLAIKYTMGAAVMVGLFGYIAGGGLLLHCLNGGR
jgi:hypothetical protein